MDCHEICSMNKGRFDGKRVNRDGICYAPEGCSLRQRIAALTAYNERMGGYIAEVKANRDEAVKRIEELHQERRQTEAERDALRAEVERKTKALERALREMEMWRDQGDTTGDSEFVPSGIGRLLESIEMARSVLESESKPSRLNEISSEDCPPEITKIVDDNFWELAAESKPQAGEGEQ